MEHAGRRAAGDTCRRPRGVPQNLAPAGPEWEADAERFALVAYSKELSLGNQPLET